MEANLFDDQVAWDVTQESFLLGHKSYLFSWGKLTCSQNIIEDWDDIVDICLTLDYDGFEVFSIDHDPLHGSFHIRGDPVLMQYIQGAFDKRFDPTSFHIWMRYGECLPILQAFNLGKNCKNKNEKLTNI